MPFEIEVSASGKERRQGFASMSPEARRDAQRRGGQRAQASGKGYRFTSETASAAGRKGGLRRAKNAKRRERDNA